MFLWIELSSLVVQFYQLGFSMDFLNSIGLLVVLDKNRAPKKSIDPIKLNCKWKENYFIFNFIAILHHFFKLINCVLRRKKHSREKLKNVLVRKPGRKSYYFSPILAKISSSRISYYFQLLKLVVVEFPTIFSFWN